MAVLCCSGKSGDSNDDSEIFGKKKKNPTAALRAFSQPINTGSLCCIVAVMQITPELIYPKEITFVAKNT